MHIDVPPRAVAEVGYHTISGVFRSNMSTYHTETVEGEKGYRGVLRGPLANRERPSVRYVIDTESGDASVAASNPSWR